MNKISVYYHDRLVGKLSFASVNKMVLFQYDEEWVKTGFSISPISLPLSNEVYEPTSDLFEGLFGVFSDSLPDAWGQLLFEKYLKQHRLDTATIIDKLSYIGKTGMGALEYVPSKDDYELELKQIDFDKIQEECNALLKSFEVQNIDNLYHMGGSSGGARPKILINYEGKELLVKFLSRYDSSNIAEEEYRYMLLAEECGINIPFVRLIETKTGRYFAIERFDRNNGKKIHMVSAAGLLECDFRAPCLDYSDLIKLTKVITKSNCDRDEMFRRMVF